jgi:hypothetical protein
MSASSLNCVIAMYTSNGEGLELACTKYLADQPFSNLRVVGVSLPIGSAPSEALAIPPARAELLQKFNIQVVRAASPFEDLPVPRCLVRTSCAAPLNVFRAEWRSV